MTTAGKNQLHIISHIIFLLIEEVHGDTSIRKSREKFLQAVYDSVYNGQNKRSS